MHSDETSTDTSLQFGHVQGTVAVVRAMTPQVSPAVDSLLDAWLSWVERASVVMQDYKSLSVLLTDLNQHVKMRVFLVDN